MSEEIYEDPDTVLLRWVKQVDPAYALSDSFKRNLQKRLANSLQSSTQVQPYIAPATKAIWEKMEQNLKEKLDSTFTVIFKYIVLFRFI